MYPTYPMYRMYPRYIEYPEYPEYLLAPLPVPNLVCEQWHREGASDHEPVLPP